MRVRMLIECDYKELETIICQHYGLKEFCVPAVEEWSNDTSYKFNIAKEPLSTWDQKKIDEVRKGNEPSFCIRAIMIDLCNAGKIDAGEYLITVSW